jgi:hypothetical protein
MRCDQNKNKTLPGSPSGIIGHEITRHQQTVNRQPNGFCGCPKSQKAND